MSPYATDTTISEVKRLTGINGYCFSVRPSELTRFKPFLL